MIDGVCNNLDFSLKKQCNICHDTKDGGIKDTALLHSVLDSQSPGVVSLSWAPLAC